MSTTTSAMAQNQKLSEVTPLITTTTTTTTTKPSQVKDDAEDLPSDFAPIEPLPTPPKKPTSTVPALTTSQQQFAAAIKEKRMDSTQQAPGLRAISVNRAALDHPSDPVNERIHKAFVEQATKDFQSK